MTLLLDAKNIRFAYRDTPTLRDVSLTLDSGEVVALLGPNGSGKSTLIKTLLGHLSGEGSIEWDGRALSQWPRRDLAKRLAYLPQSPAFEPSETVADALRVGRAPYWGAFGLESSRDAQVVEEVAKLIELNDLLNRQMSDLSGGQRQRVFLGRCLIQEPAAMLLDEPNTFLDLKHQVEMGRLLKRLARERQIGVLMASHDLNLAGAFADRLILLKAGQIVAAGAPRDVLTSERLTEVYGVKIDVLPDRSGGLVVFPQSPANNGNALQ